MTAGYAMVLAAAGDAAETVRTRVEWSALPEGMVGVLVVVGAAAVVCTVAAAYRRERAARPRLRWVACGLRLVVLAVVAALLMRPSVARDVERTWPGRVVVLADRSASMTTADLAVPESQPEAWQAALALADAGELDGVTRHEAARRLLDGLLGRLAPTHRVQLVTFADAAETVLDVSPSGSAPLPDWTAGGTATDLAGALAGALDGGAPVAVIALTDGHDTEAGDLDAVARRARDMGVPVHFVGVGSPVQPPNVAVVDLASSDRAMLGLPLQMRALVRADGYAARTARLLLTATDVANGSTVEVMSRDVLLRGDGTRQVVDLTHAPQSAGPVRYRVAIEPQPGEARAEDNTAVRQVTVTDRQISVLLAAGTPSREYRFLKALVERAPSFDLTVRLYGSAGDSGAPLPADRAALTAYDVVVLCDPPPAGVPDGWWGELADAVDAEGVGVALIAGPTYAPGLLGDGPPNRLIDLLPVSVDGPAARALIGDPGPFTEPRDVRRAVAGRGHVITDLGAAANGGAFWDELPPLYWALPAGRVKSGATALLLTGDPAFGRDIVLSAVHSYGLGRVFYCGSSETWRWRTLGIEPFERFWLQALRYCAAGRLQGGSRRARILLDRAVYMPNEPVRIRVRLLDEELRPVERDGVTLQVRRDGEEAGSVALRPVDGTPGAYRGVFQPGGFGRFELAYAGPDGPTAAESFEVRAPDLEYRDVRADVDAMTRLAEATGGRYLGPDELAGLVASMPAGGRTLVEPGPLKPLWDTAWLLAVLVAGLCAEWIVRKWQGML